MHQTIQLFVLKKSNDTQQKYEPLGTVYKDEEMMMPLIQV